MRIAITGACGLFGRAVASAALDAGHTVVAMDRPDRLGGFDRDGVTTVAVEATSADDVRAQAVGCDAFVHLAAVTSPSGRPAHVVHDNNVVASYAALTAAADLGISRFVLASSVNALGGAFSDRPRYDYFPVDEEHPSYAQDPYSLSKWIGEQQAAAVARQFPQMTISVLRLHALVTDRAAMRHLLDTVVAHGGVKDLWGYTPLAPAADAVLSALGLDAPGSTVYTLVSSRTSSDVPSAELARVHYPEVPLRAPLTGTASFFDSSRARRALGWDA